MNAPKPTILPLAISLAILTVYLTLPTKNYYWDGIGFAQAIEDAPSLGPSLIHPNHLFYTAAGYVDYHLLQAIGFHPRALTVLRVTNSVLSAVCVYLLFQISMACFNSIYLSCALTIAFSFSANWWRFSTDANAYIPSVLFLLLCFQLLLPGHPNRPFLAALLHSGAMLFHELAVLFYPVVAVGLLLQTSPLPTRRRISILMKYSTLAFLLTGAAYYGGFFFSANEHGFRSFLSWIVSHSSDASFSFHMGGNLLYSLRGHLRLFLGGRVSLALRERPGFTIAMISVLLFMLSLLAYRVARCGRNLRSLASGRLTIDPAYKSVALMAVVWFGTYAVFLTFWLPANTFYRLFYLPSLLLLFGIILAQHENSCAGTRTYATALLAGMMAISNFTFDIFPNSRVQSNPPLEFALKMNQVWSPGTVIFYRTFNTDDWTIRYFNPETIWRHWQPADLSSLGAELHDRQLLAAMGKAHDPTGWLDTTAFDLIDSTTAGREWLRFVVPDNTHFELVNERHRIIFQGIRAPRGDY